MQVEIEQKNFNDLCAAIGKMQGTVESIERQNGRTTLALIGVIAAQIGVKILGTPVLLDIATVLGIIGIFLLMGVLLRGYQIFRSKNHKLTATGWAFTVAMGFILLVQVLVYFRDLGFIAAGTIYLVRIAQNTALLVFGWRFLGNHDLFCEIKKE